MNKPIWTVLFVLALFWIIIGLLVPAHCQTVCVRDPLIPYSTKAELQPLREKIEGWVHEKGFQTGCEQADWELLVEPLQGTGQPDSVYFVVQQTNGVGTVSVRPESYSFASWLVLLYPFGSTRTVDQHLGWSLRGGVRKSLRTVARTVAKRD